MFFLFLGKPLYSLKTQKATKVTPFNQLPSPQLLALTQICKIQKLSAYIAKFATHLVFLGKKKAVSSGSILNGSCHEDAV